MLTSCQQIAAGQRTTAYATPGLRTWQQYLKSSALTWFARNTDGPSEAAHNPRDNRQTKPVARGLGGKERVEGASPCLVGHTAAGVRDLQLYVIAVSQMIRDGCR